MIECIPFILWKEVTKLSVEIVYCLLQCLSPLQQRKKLTIDPQPVPLGPHPPPRSTLIVDQSKPP